MNFLAHLHIRFSWSIIFVYHFYVRMMPANAVCTMHSDRQVFIYLLSRHNMNELLAQKAELK